MLMGPEICGAESEGLPLHAVACEECGSSYQYLVVYCNLLYCYAFSLHTLLHNNIIRKYSKSFTLLPVFHDHRMIRVFSKLCVCTARFTSPSSKYFSFLSLVITDTLINYLYSQTITFGSITFVNCFGERKGKICIRN